MEARIETFAPGFRDLILARHVLSPADLEARDANLVHGDVGAGSYMLDQMVFRPVARPHPVPHAGARAVPRQRRDVPRRLGPGAPGPRAARAALTEHRLRRFISLPGGPRGHERPLHAGPARAAVWAALADPGELRLLGRRLEADPRRRPGLAGARLPLPPHDRLRPVHGRDHTEALEAEPPRRLVLRAKGRPALTARVTLDLQPQAGGTLVRMGEHPDGFFAPLGLNPLFHLATRCATQSR